MRNCPKCGHADVKDSATICKWCRQPIATTTAATEHTRTCPFCAEEIQAAAVVCKHCRRDLPAIDPARFSTTITKSPTQPKSAGARLAQLAVYALLAFGGITVLIALSSNSKATPEASRPTMNVRVAWSATELQVTNISATPGIVATIYVNGTPPGGFRGDAELPETGKSIRLPLRDFVTKSGDRFNPITQAPTVVWIGGGSYDYRSFGR
jgi:hypothetical protein